MEKATAQQAYENACKIIDEEIEDFAKAQKRFEPGDTQHQFFAAHIKTLRRIQKTIQTLAELQEAITLDEVQFKDIFASLDIVKNS